jgi:hypothetical protein
MKRPAEKTLYPILARWLKWLKWPKWSAFSRFGVGV